MMPPLASAARAQSPGTRRLIVSMGALKSIAFQNVGPGGWDMYLVTFERGQLDWRISMTADGKIDSELLKPLLLGMRQ